MQVGRGDQVKVYKCASPEAKDLNDTLCSNIAWPIEDQDGGRHQLLGVLGLEH